MSERQGGAGEASDELTRDIERMSFEEAMAALEQLVGRLESGRVDLEQSIALYERGAALRAFCETKLRAAEMRVEQIVQDDAGAATGLSAAGGEA